MIDCLQDKEEENLHARLDKALYNEDELISIKTPLNLPYYINSAGYERAYGSVNVNGVEYEYVKQRIYQDTLELLCLPNQAKTQLQTAKNEWFKLSVEGQSQSNKKSPNIAKISLPDFFQEQVFAPAAMASLITTAYSSRGRHFLPADYYARQERPPQSMQASI
jgi:hypothetical protein